MTNLSKAGLVKSVQGKNGGYSFAQKADKIFISNIIEAVEGYEKYLGCILGLLAKVIFYSLLKSTVTFVVLLTVT